MLHEFLTTNRIALIERCRAKAAQRSAPRPSAAEFEHGIPLFLDQLVGTLQAEEASEPLRSRRISGAPGGLPTQPARSEIGATATRHGRELLENGFTVDQVVHAYGDLCQAVTELALETHAPINVDEFRTLNRCLDNAIADAVTEFSYRHDSVIAEKGGQVFDERLRVLASELRNHIKSATLAVAAIKDGNVGLKGATGAILDLSLLSLRSAIDRSFAEAWALAGLPARHYLMSVPDFIAEVEISTGFEARSRQCTFTVGKVDEGLTVDADRDLLFSAVQHLLRNAFTFTGPRTEVSLCAYGAGDRVLIDVADHCGGLPPDTAGRLLSAAGPGTRCAPECGLLACKRSVEANGGELKVRDIPGIGCVFTIDLPRRTLQ